MSLTISNGGNAIKNWHAIYNMGDYTMTYRTGQGNDHFTFKTASLNLPKVITRQWVMRQIGEDPIIKFNDERIVSSLDYTDMVTKLFAYGRVIVIPYVDDFGEFRYYCISNFSNITYALNSGRLESLMIESGMRTEYYEYQLMLPQNQMLYRTVKKETEDQDSPIVSWTDWEPVLLEPFYLELRLNADRYPIPIWGNAVDLIEDVNIAHHELMVSMNLQRPIILVPNDASSGLTGVNMNAPFFLSEIHRAMRSHPNIPDEYTDIKQFGGNFSPKPYIDSINYMLAQIGVICGLGKTALSFSDTANRNNSRVTATEIMFNTNDEYISQTMLNKITAKAIKILEASRLSYEHNTTIEVNDLEVKIQDNLQNEKASFNMMLLEDHNKGLISDDFYLQQRYPDFDINDIKTTVQEVSQEVEVSGEINEQPLGETLTPQAM